MPWAAAGAVAGALITSNSAGKAADQQGESAQAAIAAQERAQAQMRQDLSPWTTAGGAAQTKLNQYLGLGGAGGGGVTSIGLATGLSPDQVRQQLLSRYTTSSSGGGQPVAQMISPGAGAPAVPTYAAQAAPSGFNSVLGWIGSEADAMAKFGTRQGLQEWQTFQERVARGEGNGTGGQTVTLERPTGNAGVNESYQVNVGGNSGTSSVDEAGLNAAIQKYYEEQQAQNAAATSDPKYGSLLRAFHDGAEFDSGPAFSFTGENLASDPGYKFGLDQGTQGMERAQAARGNFFSGAALKEATRFNEDYAGTKFNEAFNRNLTEYGTNLNRRQNEWNTNLGAYNANRNSIYDFLTGVSRTGQNSAAQVGTSNNRAAESAGQYLTNAGSGQSAATVAGGNALTSAINTGVNTYNGNNLNSAAGWNTMLANNNIGRSGNNYNGASTNPSAANYVNQYD